jgi:very-short-patch-repair endonuclease
MLLEAQTKEKFGYTSDQLSKKSSKPILLGCDYCNENYESSNKRREVAHKIIANDCCNKCKYKKMAEINKIRYGVDNVFQLKSVKEKIVATNTEKYGVASPQQSDKIRQKTKRTCIERYGVENVILCPEIKAKQENTNTARYGGTSPTSSEEIKSKVRSTNLEKFGHEYYLASQDCKDRVLEKYGVDNVFKLESVKEKIRGSKIQSGKIKIYQGRSVEDWAEESGFTRSHFNDLVNQFGWEFAATCGKRYTNIEHGIRLILQDLKLDYIFDKKLGPYRPDFIVGNLIIEADGLWFHSDATNKDDKYHEKKRKFYISEGYKPLFFRQDEILNKFEIVKSIILNKLGLSVKYYARKLKVAEIDKNTGSSFLLENHLMGKGQGRCFALLDGDEILACLRMKKIKDGWEISRFATKSGVSVTGGFSRLLSFFKREIKTSITTFVDLRYGSGEYMPSLGFEEKGYHLSFKWTDGKKTFHRMQFSGNSGYQHGLYKIWDCGQMKFVLM